MQIFYLDNIDLGQLNLKHDVFPRIKAFNCNLLGKMIQADTDKATGAYGCSKVNIHFSVLHTDNNYINFPRLIAMKQLF
jgi:hypothetical protein